MNKPTINPGPWLIAKDDEPKPFTLYRRRNGASLSGMYEAYRIAGKEVRFSTHEQATQKAKELEAVNG